MARRGAGRVYKQRNGCKLWYIQYYKNGRRYREATGTDDRDEATRKLNAKLGQIATGTFVGPRLERIRVSELAEPFFRDLRINCRKGKQPKMRWDKHLQPFFGPRRVADVTTDVINEYVDLRLKEGAQNATVNRELAALRRMFRLGYYATPRKVAHLPKFPRQKENNVRSGFVDDSQFDSLTKQNPPLWLRAMLEMGYEYGWRKGELTGLRARNVDLASRTIRLDPGTTKNDQGRLAVMTTNVEVLLRQCVDGKRPEDRVFSRKGHSVIGDFRKRWRKLCVRAGLGHWVCPTCQNDVPVDAKGKCPECSRQWSKRELRYVGLIFHDLRRSGVRNLVRAGVSEKVAMSITGHKTRAVFDRYNIVSEHDLKEAARKSEARRNAQAIAISHNFGHNQDGSKERVN